MKAAVSGARSHRAATRFGLAAAISTRSGFYWRPRSDRAFAELVNKRVVSTVQAFDFAWCPWMAPLSRFPSLRNTSALSGEFDTKSKMNERPVLGRSQAMLNVRMWVILA